MIQNFTELATNNKKGDCLEILNAGLKAADPQNFMPKYLTKDGIKLDGEFIEFAKYSAIYSVAFGKAADTMTSALNALVPIKRGIIVIPKGNKSKMLGDRFEIFNSRHPLPDQTSVKAAKHILKFVQKRHHDELVIFLISGGGSSLVALPNGISLDDKIHANDLLLKSGCTIQELNCIRKQISKIKGGKIAAETRCKGVSLIMSDVEGDDPSSIASGPTYSNNTTSKDALDIIAKYSLGNKMPKEIIDVLNNTIDEISSNNLPYRIIARNADCIDAMSKVAADKDYKISTTQIFGDIKSAVPKILDNIPSNSNECLLFGGETTVKVLGKGNGGRNQELVLRLLKNTQDLQHLVIAAMGTDGIDGNSSFAGAITQNNQTDPNLIKEYLRNSDSARFFQKRKENIITGPTHTNLMDIGMILS